MGYLYIAFTLLFTIYGQIIMKWRFNTLGFKLPQTSVLESIMALFKIIFDPYIFSGFVSAFMASLFWMAAMTKFEITVAYPFMSLAPVLVFLLGILFLNETFTYGKVLGLVLIIVGTIITVKY